MSSPPRRSATVARSNSPRCSSEHHTTKMGGPPGRTDHPAPSSGAFRQTPIERLCVSASNRALHPRATPPGWGRAGPAWGIGLPFPGGRYAGTSTEPDPSTASSTGTVSSRKLHGLWSIAMPRVGTSAPEREEFAGYFTTCKAVGLFAVRVGFIPLCWNYEYLSVSYTYHTNIEECRCGTLGVPDWHFPGVILSLPWCRTGTAVRSPMPVRSSIGCARFRASSGVMALSVPVWH